MINLGGIMSNFDSRAKNWDTEEKINRSKSVADVIKKQVKLNNNMKVLDFGCGTGLLSYFLIDYVKSIHAIDLSENMLKILKEKNTDNKNITTELTGIFDINSKFDLIVSSMVMHHIENTPKLAKKLYDSTTDNGIVAIADLAFEDGSFHSSHEGVFYNGFKPEFIITTFKNVGFSDVSIIPNIFIMKKNNKEYPLFLLIAKK